MQQRQSRMTPLSKIPPKQELYSDVPMATVPEDPHTTFFFAHHRTLALLRTLGFDGQAINFLLRKAISFCTVWSNHRWSVIRSSVTFSNKNKAASRDHFRVAIISGSIWGSFRGLYRSVVHHLYRYTTEDSLASSGLI